MNLFAELESVLAQNGKIWSDVRAVGSADGFIDLAKFKQLAEATDYDNDWGLYEVPLDLRVELDDMVLVRREYDGKERWEAVKFRLVNLNRELDVKCLKYKVKGFSLIHIFKEKAKFGRILGEK